MLHESLKLKLSPELIKAEEMGKKIGPRAAGIPGEGIY